MQRVEKTKRVFFWALIVPFFLGYNSAFGEQRKIDLDFSHQRLSATIKSAPIRNIIAEIEAEKGVWFELWLKGGDSVLDEKLSVEFEDLTVKDGLKRIFSSLNHSFVFDQNGQLLGVYLFGKPEPRRRYIRKRRVTPRRTTNRFRR
jgi:hypothetical protein